MAGIFSGCASHALVSSTKDLTNIFGTTVPGRQLIPTSQGYGVHVSGHHWCFELRAGDAMVSIQTA